MSPEISGGSLDASNAENETVSAPLRLRDRKDIGENFAIHTIPVENYLGHLGIDPHMEGIKVTAEAMSRQIGINSKWVSREIMRFQIMPFMEDVRYASGKQEVYPPYVTELVREQYEWQQHFLALPSHLNLKQIADEVGRSRVWAERQIEGFGAISGKYRTGKNKRIVMYPRSVVKRLRDINFATPIDNGGVSLTVLNEIIGRDDGWIERHLQKRGFMPEKRRSTITGLINIYYPQDVMDIIPQLKSETYPPAGNWMTVERMSDQLGKSPLWVRNRITDEIKRQVEVRLDDALKPSEHYPPEFFEDLKVQCDAFDQLPEARGWHTIGKLVELTGQDYEWIQRRLKEARMRPQWRVIPAASREYFCYAPRALHVIRQAIIDREPGADGWMTAHALTGLLPKSKNWVNLRLKEYRDVAELRQDSQRVGRLHYPSWMLDVLQEEIKELSEYPEADDWMTISGLEKLVGKHALWIAQQLPGLGIESEQRLDKRGIIQEHYSPESQRKLSQYVLEHFTYPEADGWMTYSELFAYVGRSKKWLLEQLEKLEHEGETRLDRNKTPRLHYDPSIAEKIRLMGKALEPINMLSVQQVIEESGRSASWVTSRLKRSRLGEERFNDNGGVSTFYPLRILRIINEMKPLPRRKKPLIKNKK